MNKFIILAILISKIFAISLNEYIDLSLQNSIDSYDITDSKIFSKMAVRSEENRFRVKISPSSSASSKSGQQSISIGLSAKQKFTTGTTLYASSSALYNSNDNFSDTYGTSTTVGIKQSLFQRFGEKYNTLELFVAKQNDTLTKLKTKKAYQDIIIKAASLYFNAQLVRQKEAIYKNSLKRSLKNLDVAKAKQKMGLSPKTDVYRANLAYLGQQQQAIAVREDLETSISNASIYINFSEDKALKIDENIPFLSWEPIALDIDKILKSNILWQEILMKERILKRKLFNAKKEMLPDITLDINYNLAGANEAVSDIASIDERDFSVTLSSSYSFDNLDKKQYIQTLILKQNRLVRDKRVLKRTILKSLKQYETRYYSLKNQLSISQMKKENSIKALAVAQVRYKRGLASNLDITDAELALSNSMIAYYTNLVQYNLNILDFAKALNILDSDFIKKASL